MSDILEEIKNPGKSIFVSANAGSGKTFILVARVLNLLLAGEEPSKILCISFTEAAAEEMKERIKNQLLKWHRGEFDGDLLLKQASNEWILKAKGLYAKVVLGLKMPKIITFHGFCMQIIKNFSAESGLAYRPSILSSGLEQILKKEVFKTLVFQEETRVLVNELKMVFSNFTLQSAILPEILSKRASLGVLKEDAHLKPYEMLGLEYEEGLVNEIIARMEGEFLSSFDFSVVRRLFSSINGLDKQSEMQKKKLPLMEEVLAKKTFNLLKKALLTNDETIIKKGFITKELLEKSPLVQELYEKIVQEILEFISRRGRVLTAKLSEVAILLISHILNGYEKKKKEMEVLDFEDLIHITKKALSSHERDFILFKLDGGINHILVDEAQDTNFAQWEILHSILEEFFAGKGRDEALKSLFIVGDEKQCIFGFQSSEPKALKTVLEKYKRNLEVFSLQTSYRSTGLVLELVDLIFGKEPYRGLVSESIYNAHISWKTSGFGRIEILPLLEKPAKVMALQEEGFIMPWEEAVQEEGLKLGIAGQIVGKIVEILEEGRFIPSKKRQVKPCDFMLLAKSRDFELFKEIKLKLSVFKIGVSMGDKMPLSESFAMQDFIALLKFLLNKGQLQALACVLKSPMFNLSLQEFEDVFLPEHSLLVTKIESFRPLLQGTLEAFFIAVFAEFKGKYNENEVKEISYIFNLIEEYKQTAPFPCFEGFIQFVERLIKMGEAFKINFNENKESVKINTVHGAKGLESPIVFILNTTEVFARKASQEYFAFGESAILLSKKEYACTEWEHIKNAKKRADYAEYLRLLYVAITRAEEELYVFGRSLAILEDEEFPSWHEIISKALGCEKRQIGSIEKGITEERALKEGEIAISSESFEIPPEMKSFTSATNSAKGLKEMKNLEVGSCIHLMLHLRGDGVYIPFFENKFTNLSEGEILELQLKACKIRQSFPYLFLEDVRSEVEIMLEDGPNGFFIGKIDKLCILENEVQIYDFKYYLEEKITPEIKEQMFAYKKAIFKIYSTKTIKCFILWVKSELIQEVV